MTTYTGPVRRRRYGRGHRYEDANGLKVPGVTTILSDGIPKPALVNWAANTTANAAIDRWDELSELPPSKRLSALQKARYADRDAAANRGTEVHDLAQRYLQGAHIDIPDSVAGHVESYIAFVDDWTPTPVLVETVVVSHTHGYAGTLDAIVDLPGHGRALLDIKTSRSGIFGETALQLAAYRYADTYLDTDDTEQPMPAVDAVFGLHLRSDGYSLLPITAGPDEHRTFLYAQQIAHFTTTTAKQLVGDPLTPARDTRRRRLEHAP
ncbi:Phage protein [Pseudonocardia sp. Ae168_Ps1]|uniref:hypothetical protein n=1 Tax=unclassified Pseudonocardia TaxID=2619320 RepID=UPI00094B26E0|nr:MULTISPECIES: hypothetical protein [unclassified Pseudonocardia]OLL69855.1 Phage protein [Pseudonocardia sp. Ae150A_Ps1]OLL69988.1 Phage protein [Pseudonocardia sp. Ae168_Ps1]OLL89113.1 Phage protein [Pseudonocardia sp. Ae356_Ps1]